MKHWIALVPVLLLAQHQAPADEANAATARTRKSLPRLVAGGSSNELKAALKVLFEAGGKENIEPILRLIPALPPEEVAVYWDLVQGVCSFTDREALQHLGEAILRLQATAHSRDLAYGLAKNRSPQVVLALAPCLEKGPADLQIMAAEKIGTIFTPEAVDALVAALKREDGKKATELSELIQHALQDITGKDFKSSVNWEGWWKANREKPLEGGRPREAGATSTGTVVDRLDRARAKGFEGLEKAPKKSIVVLSAEFPERDLNNARKSGGQTLDLVLRSMGVPHVVVKRPDFEKHNLNGVGAILINCAQFNTFCICPTCKPGGSTQNRLRQCTGCEKHITFTGKLSGAAIKKIQEFVKRGGYLFCEDWTVKEVIERAFPQYISAGKVLKDSNIDVVPVKGRVTHPYLRGIFRPELAEPKQDEPEAEDDSDDPPGKSDGGTVARKPDPPEPKVGEVAPELVKVRHQWSVDDESWALHIADNAKVTALLTSSKLQGEAPGEAVVALCFRPGADGGDAANVGRLRGGPGMVMQVLSHFGKQESQEDEYTLQNLLVNFLISANVARTQDELAHKPRKKKAEGGEAGSGDKGAAEPEKKEEK